MGRAKLTIGETSPNLFLDCLMMSQGDLLASVSIDASDVIPPVFGPNDEEAAEMTAKGIDPSTLGRPSGFQSIQDIECVVKKAASLWASYAAIAGIAQLSITKKGPFSLIAKIENHHRYACYEETHEDHKRFGDQVLGSSLRDFKPQEMQDKPWIEIDGEKFLYRGPPRIEKCIFITRIFEGTTPSNIDSIVQEIAEKEQKGWMIGSFGYQLFTANEGVLRYLAFSRPHNYDPEKTYPHGRVEIKGDEMFYFPHGESRATDFTSLRMK